MKIYVRHILVLLSGILFVLFYSCGDPAVGPITGSLEDNYARWKKLGIDSYSITEQRMCFCIDGGVRATVMVRGNVIVSVSDSATAKQLPQERWQWYKTIDQLFETAISAQNSKPAIFDLQFEPSYGFPKYIWVDPNAQIADEEYGFNITSFSAQK